VSGLPQVLKPFYRLTEVALADGGDVSASCGVF